MSRVLDASLPRGFPRRYQVAYRPENRDVVVEFELPPQEVVPLARRKDQRTANPHVIVTKGTKAGRSPASAAYVSHLLDGCGVPLRALRCTRLADLVNTIGPRLVAAAFGMNPEGVMFYLAGHVDDGRLHDPVRRR